MVANSLYHQLDNTIVWPYFKQSNTNPALVSWSWVYWPDQWPNKELHDFIIDAQ